MFAFFQKKRLDPDEAGGKQRPILIPESIYRRMINHCLEERPLEACGLLTGVVGQVHGGYATDNAHRSSILYKVEDRHLHQVFQETRTTRQEIIGIYHSHVKTDAVPSRTDIDQATWPEAYYLIISLANRNPVARAFRIVDQQVTEHPVVIQPERAGDWHDLRRAVRETAESAERAESSHE